MNITFNSLAWKEQRYICNFLDVGDLLSVPLHQWTPASCLRGLFCSQLKDIRLMVIKCQGDYEKQDTYQAWWWRHCPSQFWHRRSTCLFGENCLRLLCHTPPLQLCCRGCNWKANNMLWMCLKLSRKNTNNHTYEVHVQIHVLRKKFHLGMRLRNLSCPAVSQSCSRTVRSWNSKVD